MKKYRIDVEVVGYTTVIVEANSLDEAEDLAVGEAFKLKVADLSYKVAECTSLGDDE